ncbi:MAG: hypothetical protein EPO21_19060 [Chloroflexota bacterium]|nr:MAG: hypothetical protein EPO21_19060 [Chloroflexota bacterium]
MAVYGVECCPYLGLQNDASSYKPYPTGCANCMASSRSHCPTVNEQKLVCLSRVHRLCPRFLKAAPGRPAQRPIPSRGKLRTGAVILPLVVVAVVLVAFGFHVVNLGVDSLWWDETLSFNRANGGLLYTLSNQILLGPLVTIDQHPPLYFALLSGLLAIAGPSEYVLRFPSVAYTILAVPLAYVTGSRMAGRTAGIAVAALWATSPFLMWAAWEARPYALLALLSFLSVYLLLRALDDSHHPGWAIAWIVSLAAMFATQYMSAILIGCELVAAVLYVIAGRTQRRRILAGGILALGVLAAPTSFFVLQRFRTVADSAYSISLIAFVQDLPHNLGIRGASEFLPLPVLLIPFGIVLAGGILSLASPSRFRVAIVMASVLVIPFLGLYLLIEWGRVTYSARYAAFLAPGYYILLGLGTARLFRFRRAAGIVALLCLAGIGVAALIYVQTSMVNTKQNLRGVSAHIVREAREDDAVLLTSSKLYTTLEYYQVGSLDQYRLRTFADGATPEEVTEQLASIASQHRRLWILTDYWDHQKDSDLLAILDTSYSRLEKITFTGPDYFQDIYLYQTSPRLVDRLPSGVAPVTATVGDNIRLIGYRMEPSTATPGRIYLTLFWQALATPQKLRVFGNLTDSQGRIWASFDGEPYGGFFPTTSWKQGDIVVDERVLDPDPGTPPGRYSLSVGLRRSEDSQALPVVTPGRLPRESMPLGDIELQGFDAVNTRALPANATRLDSQVGPLVLLAAKSPIADLHPGENVPLRLYWRLSSDAQPINRINIRLALLAPNGKVITSMVSSMFNDLPDSQKVNGALLASDHTMRIPQGVASGQYQVAAYVGRNDAPFWRIGPSWWIFASDRTTVTTIRVHAFDYQVDIPATSSAVGKDVGYLAQLAAVSIGAGWRVAPEASGALAFGPEGKRPSGLNVTLYWRAQAQTDQSLIAFVQLLNAEGRLVAQHDSIPQLGKRPTSGWLPPEVVTDPHPLVGLEGLRPGRYTLIAGLYDSATGRRLPVATDDYVTLGSVLIQ